MSDVNGTYEWSTIDMVVVAAIFAIGLLSFMVVKRAFSWPLLVLGLCGVWAAVGNVAHLYAFELNPLDHGALTLAIHVFKDASAMGVVTVWSIVCANQLAGLAPSLISPAYRSPWVRPILDFAGLVFLPFFVLAVVTGIAATVANPIPANLETLSTPLAILYRYLIVGPVVLYGLFVAYWCFRLFGPNKHAWRIGIRIRMILCGGTFAGTAVFCATYIAWPVASPGNVTSIMQLVAFVITYAMGITYMCPIRGQSHNEIDMRNFRRDEGSYIDTAYAVDGLCKQDLIAQWKTITEMFGWAAWLMGPERISEGQLRSATLSVYLVHSPAADGRGLPAADNELERGVPGGAANDEGSVLDRYDISTDHPLATELEADLQSQRDAHYAVRVLADPKLMTRLESGPGLRDEPEWIQLLAVVLADCQTLTAELADKILDQEAPCVEPDIIEKGLAFSRWKQRKVNQ